MAAYLSPIHFAALPIQVISPPNLSTSQPFTPSYMPFAAVTTFGKALATKLTAPATMPPNDSAIEAKPSTRKAFAAS